MRRSFSARELDPGIRIQPMQGLLLDPPRHMQRNVRLDTLMRLRWLSVLGQIAAVMVVHYGLGFALPICACLAVITLSAFSTSRCGWVSADAAAGSRPCRLAARLRYRATRCLVVLHRRFAKSLCFPVSRTGADFRHGAAAAYDIDARQFCGVLCEPVVFCALPACLGTSKIRWSCRRSICWASGYRF